MANDKQYRVTVGGESQLWDVDKYERNKDKLTSSYPDAKVEEVGYMSANDEQVIPGEKYRITIGDEQQEWDSDKLNRNKGHLLQQYPDAKIERLGVLGSTLQQPESEEETIRGFGAAAKQSAKSLGAGVRNAWGEFTNMFTGSSRDDVKALSEFDRMIAEGKDVAEETENTWSGIGRDLRTAALEILPNFLVKGWKERVHDKAEEQKILRNIHDALKETNGDVDKARSLLVERAKDMSYGDTQMAMAAETMSEMKPTEGFGAWLGENAVQMIPSASALIVGAVTKSPTAARIIGQLGMGGMTAATAGQSMYEARQSGANDYETRKAGIVDGMIEYLTEKIPFDRYTKRLTGKIRKETAEALSDALSSPNSPAKEEMQNVLTKANEVLGGKLFSKKSATDYLLDMAAEGASEFSAEALQTITSIIYEEPENYPTITEVLSNGWQGFLAGAFMGAVLGGSSAALANHQHKERRRQQGFVKIALVDNGENGQDVGEVVAYDPEADRFTITDGNNSYEVEREAIKQTFDYTVGEFESGIYRQLEDDAIAGGNVSNGQVVASADRLGNARQKLEDAMSQAGYTDEQKNTVFADLDKGDVPDFHPQAKALWNAADSYTDALNRDREIQSAREARADNERKSVLDAMQQQMGGEFWQKGSTTMQENGMEIVEPDMVEVGTMQNGKQVYILSTPNDNGEVPAITEDGKKMFIRHTDLQDGTQLMPLQEFLDAKVSEQKRQAEQLRMAQEAAPQLDAIRQKYQMGVQVNLGTEESPTLGQVIGIKPENDGVIIQTESGIAPYTFEQLADMEGTPIRVMTDAQQAAAEAAEIQAAEATRMTELAQTPEQISEAEKETDNAAQMENVATETPLPTNPDGSVNEDALFRESPERWAVWNDEQSQDGGVSSAQYIETKLAKAQARLAELQNMYSVEDSLNKKRTIQAVIVKQQGVVDDLAAVMQKYTPAETVQSTPAVAQQERTTESVLASLNDGTLTEEEIRDNIDANLAEAQKSYDKYAKKAPKMGTDKDAYLAEKQKYEQGLPALQQEVDFWNGVKQAYEGAMQQESLPTEESMRPELTEEDMNPQTPQELAARELGLKEGGIRLLWDSVRAHTNFGNGERQKFFGIFRSKEKGGMTIEAAGDRLMEIDREYTLGLLDQSDPMAGVNAILDVLGDVQTIGDLRNYIANNREAQVAREASAAYSAMNAEFEATHGMTMEEWAHANEVQRIEIMSKSALTEAEEYERNVKFAEEENQYGTNEQSTGTEGVSGGENQGDAGNVEGAADSLYRQGDSILQEAQSDNTGGETVSAGQTTEDVSEGDNQDGDTSVHAGEQTSEVSRIFAPSAEVIAKIVAERREAVHERINTWINKLGIKINIIDSYRDVENEDARINISKGNKTFGWFEQSTGEIFIYVPDFLSYDAEVANEEIDKTILHEGVAHKGLRDMLGEEKFGELCDRVWNEIMTEKQRDEFINYPGVNGNTRAAADEFIASVSENVKQDTVWDKIANFFKDILNSIGIDIKVKDNDLEGLIKQSYANLAKNGAKTDSNSNQQADGNVRFRTQDILGFAQKHHVSEKFVSDFADAMARNSSSAAAYALKEIKRELRINNTNLTFAEFAHVYAPIKQELFEQFGDYDALHEAEMQRIIEARNLMEAAEQKAREEAEKEMQRLKEFEDMDDIALDEAYFAAMEAGDESRMRDIVNDAARRNGYEDTDFRMAHKAPSYDELGYDGSMVDVANNLNGFRDSIEEQFRMNRDSARQESVDAIRKAFSAIEKGKTPSVKVYRAVPRGLQEGSLRNGDWVTLSRAYAVAHGENALEGNYDIMEAPVSASDIYWDGNDINEWGYDDKSDYKYKNTANNRKLNILVTRDDGGNIIPPSQRFNEKENDVRFRVEQTKNKVESLFNAAVNGTFKGKPVSIGTLTTEGKKYLESISGLTFKNKVDFMLNASDLVHMYNEHFGENEKDTGSNIPLTIDDIRNIVDVVLNPEKVLYLGEDEGKRFAFLAPADSGAYNLIEVYTTKRGNLSSKTFYKTKKGVSHRAMILEKESRHSTSEANGATLSDAKIPILFDIANQEEGTTRFRITSEQDAAYMKAVKAGDMETAQKMVLEAAKLAMPNTKVVDKDGSPKVVYHGTLADKLTRFDKDLIGSRYSFDEKGFFFISRESIAKDYATPDFGTGQGTIIPAFINLTNPLFVNQKWASINGLGNRVFKDNDVIEFWDNYQTLMIEESENNDGVIISDGTDLMVVAFEPSQIKSADSVTYDDAGNIIPLSERFNEKKEDIRFRSVLHGTAAKFSEFDHAHMGEGEGAQAYGWGTYLTEVEGIARTYAVTMRNNAFSDVHRENRTINSLARDLLLHNSKQEALDYLQRLLEESWSDKKRVRKQIKIISSGKFLPEGKYYAYIYTVEIPDDALYIVYEKAIGEQQGVYDAVVKALENEGWEKIESVHTTFVKGDQRIVVNTKARGVDLYAELSVAMGSDKAASEFLSRNGVVGISYPAQYRGGGRADGARNYVIFNEDDAQIQSSVRFRTSNNNQAIFVSNAAKAVEGIKQEKATPEQWLKMIEKNGGLKAGEDKWMGLSDWLKESDKKTLTKQEVLDFINENMIVIEEQHYSEDENALDGKRQEIQEALQGIFDEYVAESEDMNDDMFMKTHYDYAIQKLADELGYTAFNAPFINNNAIVELDFYEDDLDTLHELSNRLGLEKYDGTRNINDTRLNYTTEGLTDKHEIALTVPTIESWNERDDVHFGDAGDGRAVAWIRFGDAKKLLGTTEVDGKKKFNWAKVLVIDEIQSKRHQDGREKGYRSEFDRTEERNKLIEDLVATQERRAQLARESIELHDSEDVRLATIDIELDNVKNVRDYDRLTSERDEIVRIQENRDAEVRTLRSREQELQWQINQMSGQSKEYYRAIPDAPFDKNWHELAMKRMLRYAAENGYNVVAWTKGDQQAERYNIGKVISGIHKDQPTEQGYQRFEINSYTPSAPRFIFTDDEGKIVDAIDNNGEDIPDYVGMNLSEVFGKDLAIKMLGAEANTRISNDEMRVGGEGMTGFYDRMLPAFMNKYGKKWGVKVEDINFPGLEGGLTMHSVPVTEEMKASVMEGQTMFRTRRSNESPAEFLKDAVAEFGNKYNVAAPASIIKVPTRREFAKALDLEVADIDEQFHNSLLEAWKNAFGMYLPLYDEDNNITHNIVIFAKDTHRASYISDASLFHENIHGFVKDNPELLELGRWLYETDVQDRNILTIRPLADTYPEHKRHEEMLTHYVSMMMAVGGSQRALDTLPEEYKPLLNYIYERFGYNPETEDGERLRRYDSESREISGRTWTNGQSVTVTKGERESDGNGNLFRTIGTPTEQVVNNGLPLSVEEFTNLAADIYKNMPEDIRRDVVEYASRNRYDLKNAVFQISASLAEKAELTDEEIELAKLIAQKVEDAVLASGVEMTRPFTTNEALWMLYQSTNPTSEYNLIGNARKAVVTDNLGFSKSQQDEQEKDADNIRFRSARGAAANSAAAMYNNEQRSAWGMLRETYQDMYRSVKNLIEAIEQTTGKVAQSWEKILTSLNALSSKNLADKKKYLRDFLTPMWDAAIKISDNYHKSIEEIERYLMIKHGLERNKVLAARDARNFYREQAEKEIVAIKADKSLSKAEQKARIQRVEDTYDNHVSDIEAGIDAKFQEFRAKDYGGLTALFSDFADYGTREDYESEELYQQAALAARTPKFATLAEAEIEAQKEVDAFEKEVDKTLVDNLWKKINAATKETLRHQYANNMLTKEQYERVRDMFEFYVPLRGFVDTTAEDTYSYYVSGQQSKFANPLQGAKGRKTQAETPLGWIGSMAESAIQMDNKNTAKLALYYFAVNRPNNDILKITPTWYEWTGEVDADGKKIFEPVYPTFNGPQSGPAMQAQMDAFESMMEQQAQAGNAYKGKQRIDLKEAVIRAPKSTPEHIVTVKVAGEDYSIIINANPRAAQAINGMLNIDKGDNPLYRAARAILRFQASIKTSLAPLFWITNFMRDVSFAFINTSIRNDVGYTKEFAKNYPHAFRVFSYVHKNRKSALGNTKYEKYYTEFAENGGITGYTSLTNNTEYDQMMKTYAKNARAGKFIKGIKGALEVYQDLGESFEQVSRFAAYITARESGKDISESIYEAKEVTINFNRKGSGKAITWEESGKMRRKSGKPLTDAERIFFVTLGGLSPVARSLFMFFNAGMQGVRMIAKLAHEHPGKSAAWAGIVFTMGLINAMMHAMMEDDDEYLDMPDYVRRSNVLIGRNGYYFKWSLPHEVRPFYAMADIFVQHAMGRKPNENIIPELAETFGEWMPINPFKDGLNAFMPDIIRPFVEIKNNKDFTGSPIYREYRWLTEEQQKNMPAYEKGFDSTSKVLVDISEILNDVSGGDQTDAGFININPAVVEHLAQEYGGGPLKLAEQFFKTIGVMTGDQEFSIRNTPFLSTFMVAADDRYRNAHTTELFKYYKGMAEDVKRRAGEYKAEKDKVGFDKLRASDDFQIFQIYRKYEKRDKFYNEQLKRAKSDSERKEIMSLQDAHRKRMIEEISKLRLRQR